MTQRTVSDGDPTGVLRLSSYGQDPQCHGSDRAPPKVNGDPQDETTIVEVLDFKVLRMSGKFSVSNSVCMKAPLNHFSTRSIALRSPRGVRARYATRTNASACVPNVFQRVPTSLSLSSVRKGSREGQSFEMGWRSKAKKT